MGKYIEQKKETCVDISIYFQISNNWTESKLTFYINQNLMMLDTNIVLMISISDKFIDIEKNIWIWD